MTEVLAVPTRLNALLASGELDVANVSSIAYALDPDAYVLLPSVCISSDGAVESVQAERVDLVEVEGRLGHAEELERLTRPARDMFTKLIGLAGGERSRHTTSDDDYPHPHA